MMMMMMNKYSYLSNLCSSCDFNACLCEANCPDASNSVTEINTSNSSNFNSLELQVENESSQISMSQKYFSKTSSNYLSEELTSNCSDDLVIQCTTSMRPSHDINMHDSFILNDFTDDNSSSSTDVHANSSKLSNTRSLQNLTGYSGSETVYDQSG